MSNVALLLQVELVDFVCVCVCDASHDVPFMFVIAAFIAASRLLFSFLFSMCIYVNMYIYIYDVV